MKWSRIRKRYRLWKNFHGYRIIKTSNSFTRYYRHFISNFSKIAKLLTNLLKKKEKFIWTEAQDEVFIQLRDSLSTEPLLQYSDFTTLLCNDRRISLCNQRHIKLGYDRKISAYGIYILPTE